MRKTQRKRPYEARREHRPDGAPESSGLQILYGRQPVRELLLARRRKVLRIVTAESNRPSPETEEIAQLAQAAGVPVVSRPREGFEQMLGDVNHQGIAAETQPYPYVELRALVAQLQAQSGPLVLVLDHLEDPQNVGSLLRTADAAGVSGVVLPSRRACPVTPAVVRASAGAAEHLQVALVPNVVQAMLRLKEAGFWFIGLDCGKEARSLLELDVSGPLGIVVGNEGDGMRRLTRETCDFLAAIPMRGHVASLNAGVAGAVALYTVLQRRMAAAAQAQGG